MKRRRQCLRRKKKDRTRTRRKYANTRLFVIFGFLVSFFSLFFFVLLKQEHWNCALEFFLGDDHWSGPSSRGDGGGHCASNFIFDLLGFLPPFSLSLSLSLVSAFNVAEVSSEPRQNWERKKHICTLSRNGGIGQLIGKERERVNKEKIPMCAKV